VEFQVLQFVSVRPGCGLLALPQEDLLHQARVPEWLELLSGARHTSASSLGGNNCVMASIGFALLCMCIVSVLCCVHV